jgi:hypothetical protein
MPYITPHIKCYLPPELTKIDEESFIRFLSFQDEKKILEKYIIDNFKKGIRNDIGFSDENRPDNRVETFLKIGNDIEIAVYTTPTTKRPAYEKIKKGFENYLNFLLEEYEKGVSREGVITIKNEPYVSVSILIKKLNNDVANLLEGREGIRQELEIKRPLIIPEGDFKVVPIVFGRDYSQISETNARAYINALNLIKTGEKRTTGYKEGEEIIKRFKMLLLDDSLQILGGEPKEPTALTYPYENYVFIHQLEPRTIYSHKEIIDSLIKEPPKELKKNSRIGDLKKVELMLLKNLDDVLKKKGLIDEEFISDYKPVRRGDDVFVKLKGVKKRLEKYEEICSNRYIEQNIFQRPKGYG